MSIPIKTKEKREGKKRLPPEPLAPQEPARSVPCWISLLKIYICQYLSCVFWGTCAPSTVSQRGSTLHQPTRANTPSQAQMHVWRSQGRKPTWIHELVLPLAPGFGAIHQTTARSNDAQGGVAKRIKCTVSLNQNKFANPTGAISEEQHVQRWICNFPTSSETMEWRQSWGAGSRKQWINDRNW